MHSCHTQQMYYHFVLSDDTDTKVNLHMARPTLANAEGYRQGEQEDERSKKTAQTC